MVPVSGSLHHRLIALATQFLSALFLHSENVQHNSNQYCSIFLTDASCKQSKPICASLQKSLSLNKTNTEGFWRNTRPSLNVVQTIDHEGLSCFGSTEILSGFGAAHGYINMWNGARTFRFMLTCRPRGRHPDMEQRLHMTAQKFSNPQVYSIACKVQACWTTSLCFVSAASSFSVKFQKLHLVMSKLGTWTGRDWSRAGLVQRE